MLDLVDHDQEAWRRSRFSHGPHANSQGDSACHRVKAYVLPKLSLDTLASLFWLHLLLRCNHYYFLLVFHPQNIDLNGDRCPCLASWGFRGPRLPAKASSWTGGDDLRCPGFESDGHMDGHPRWTAWGWRRLGIGRLDLLLHHSHDSKENRYLAQLHLRTVRSLNPSFDWAGCAPWVAAIN